MKKLYIALAGRRNTGKSSLINVLTGQQIAIVSDVAGTTTDPVKKSYEIPGFASVVFIDTAGVDDQGELGQERVRRTKEAITQADLAVLVITNNLFTREEIDLCEYFQYYELPFIIVHNKSDLDPLHPKLKRQLEGKYHTAVIDFSTLSPNSQEIIDAIKALPADLTPKSLLGDLLHKEDIIMLVTPIDSEAPTGRLILPQVQTLRDILDNHCTSIVLQPEEIEGFLKRTGVTPNLVITDSQVFKTVAEIIPENIPLTGFSILLAREKGYFGHYIAGTRYIDQLNDGDHILMLESCSHHVSCDDIGRNKIPALLKKYTGKKLSFSHISGLDPIDDYHKYALVIQCGGCMITKNQLKNRITPFIRNNIPVSNYGMTIAFLNGIFERSIAVFDCKL